MWIETTLHSALGLILHHSEYVDPTLVDWIKDKIDQLTGVSATTIVVVLGAATVAFPIGLMALALRRAQRGRGHKR
jgi:hypothetical protein